MLCCAATDRMATEEANQVYPRRLWLIESLFAIPRNQLGALRLNL